MSNQPPTPPIPGLLNIVVTLDMKKGEVMVRGPIHLKALCIKALADAIQIVVDQPAIVKPGQTNGSAPPPVHPSQQV